MPIPALRLITPPTPPAHADHDNPPVLILTGGNGDMIRLDDRYAGFWAGAETNGIFGYPPTEVKTYDSAGDGARYGGTRRSVRPIDIKLSIASGTEQEQRARLNRLADIIDDQYGPTVLQVVCPDCGLDKARLIDVHYSDGWDGKTDTASLQKFQRIPFTFLALEPYFRAAHPVPYEWVVDDSKPFLSTTTNFFDAELADSQVLGAVDIVNPGDVPARARWTFTGPGGPITVAGPNGGFTIETTLTAGSVLIAADGALTTGAGGNAYNLFAPSPKLWLIPPKTSRATVDMGSAATGSSVLMEFTPRFKRGM